MTDSIQTTRRKTLRTLAALGTGAALGGDALSAPLQPEDGPRLERDVVRQGLDFRPYTQIEPGFDREADCVVTEGVSQTNLTMVEEAQEWAPRCGVEGPGVVHRFTVGGFHAGNILPEIEVSLAGSKDCGSATLTPHYSFWASGLRDDSEDWTQEDYLRDPTESAEEVRQKTLDSGLDKRGLAFNVALALGTYAVGLNPVGAFAISLAELVRIWGDEYHRTYNQYADDAILVKPDHEDPLKVSYLDFSVVLPPGASTTVEVSFDYQDTGWDDDIYDVFNIAPPREVFGDRTFEIEVPANDPSNSLSDDATEAASIEAQSYPIRAYDSGPLSRGLEAETPPDLVLDGISKSRQLDAYPQELVESDFPDTGSESQLQVTREGLYPVKYQYDYVDYSGAQWKQMQYTAERAVQIGERTAIPDVEGPSVTVEGPSIVHPVDRPVFDGDVGTSGVLQDRSWELTKLQTGVENHEWVPVDYSTDLRAADSESFQPDASFSDEHYRVELEATDDQETAKTFHRFRVTEDAPYSITPSIDAPNVIRADQESTFSVEVVENVDIASVSWDGLDGSGQRAQHTFDRAGRKSVGVTVVDENGVEGTAEVDVTVEEAPEVQEEFPDGVYVDESNTYRLSIDHLDDPSVSWWTVGPHQTEPNTLVGYDGESIEHTFDTEGNHALGANVKTENDVLIEVRDTVAVSRPKEPSVSIHTPDEPIPIDEQVKFESSYDVETASSPDLTWSGDVDRTSGAGTFQTFTESGEKDVRLSIEDSFGQTAQDRVTVDVVAPDPTVGILGSTDLSQGELETFEAAVNSPNGEIIGYTWTWENPNEYSPRPEGGDTFEFQSALVGTHELTLEVVDEQNETAKVTEEIDVRAADGPTARFSKENVDSSTIRLDAGSSTGEGALVEFDWEIDPLIDAPGDDPPLTRDGDTTEYSNSRAYAAFVELTVTDEFDNSDSTKREVRF